MNLSSSDFAAFFEALWGHEPFPWQQRLLDRVDDAGWPQTLDLPTGTGKTSVLDIACFALAIDAARPRNERRHCRKIALVIDRRVVVDQGYERARVISDRIDSAKDGILARVRVLLRSLHSGYGSDRAIGFTALRGGMVRDDDWARSPDQPLFLVSTVDQVGSRLLFRGYGVSPTMAPVHAGLLGSDTLYLLDEVHLSRPFEQTLTAVVRYADSGLVEQKVVRPPTLVKMSATVGKRDRDTFELDGEDLSHPVLRQRLAASKPARLAPLVNTPVEEAKARPKIARACIEQARELLEEDRCEVVALIANRVDTAREAARLAKESKWFARMKGEVVLLTGRMRPLDRKRAQRAVLRRIEAGRRRGSGEKLLVVSTQAIEAGADFDFDAMVTECASLDALRQRFGRVDRRGEMGEAPAVIVTTSRAAAKGADDPVYGTALAATWTWLSQLAEQLEGAVDFGIAAQRELPTPPPELLAPTPDAPTLLPAYLDAWVQTSPRPALEPDLPVFLHGPQRESGDVHVVWRADIPRQLLTDQKQAQDRLDDLRTVLTACPPSGLEAMPVPVWTARSWLQAIAARREGKEPPGPVPGMSDVEGAAPPGEADTRNARDGGAGCAPAIIWAGDETRIARGPRDLRPGDTLVVPATYGGIGMDNWDPGSVDPVPDVGDQAQLEHRGRATVRWDAATLGSWLPPGNGPPSVSREEIETLGSRATREAFRGWTADLRREGLPTWAQVALRQMDRFMPRITEVPPLDVPSPQGSKPPWRVAVSPRRLPKEVLREIGRSEAEIANVSWTEGDDGSFTAREVPLKAHLAGVRDVGKELAEHAGLGGELTDDIALAGYIHDLGKADPRFQTMLFGGDEVRAAVADEPLAKSAIPVFDRAARSRAREQAGYPVRTRHELMSVVLAALDPSFRARAHDWDLVLHLVTSHHGFCRPLAPVAEDPTPVAVSVDLEGPTLTARSDHALARLDSGISERFWRLTRRYGWHGLAVLEATLRLADHRRSEAEISKKEEGEADVG